MKLHPTLALILSFAAAITAQTPLGTVTGVAIDPATSVVPDAQVTLRNIQTGVERQARTNERGVYNFPNLSPGAYKLLAEKAGFKKYETQDFPLQAFRVVRQDIRFEIQTAATEITVSEVASPVTSIDTPSISASLSTRQIRELPTNLRSVFNNAGDSGVIFQMMPLTVPGVQEVGSGAFFIAPGTGPNGIRTKVDGIETNFGNFGSPDPVSQPSMESLGEFSANIITNRAEFGGLAVIQSVTKAGNNEYHGGIFWYARNNAFDARNPFLTLRSFQNIHNFGGAFSGPLRKDRTFFHITWDETHGSRAYAFVSNVPTLAQRQGDFSGTAALRNPYGNINPIGPNNALLPQYVSPTAKKAQDLFFPLPNYGPPDLQAGNYRASFNGPETHRILEARGDHNWKGHTSFLRYQFKNSDYDIPGARSALPPTTMGTSANNRTVHFGTLGDVVAMRPNLVNEFRMGFVVLESGSTIPMKGDGLIRELGIAGLPARGDLPGIPNINITGYSSVTQTLLNPVIDGRFQVADNISWTRGRHTMKFGFEFARWFVNRYLPVETGLYGNFSFTNRYTGNPYADFLLGIPQSVTRVDPYPTQYTRWSNFDWYLQDDWKVTRKLTMSYGLRYESNGAATPAGDNIYSFDIPTGSIVVPNANTRRIFSPYLPATIPVVDGDKAGYPRALRNTDRNNFAPRFGFSYQPFNDAKTVIRGGWGVYYAPFTGAVTGALAAGPFAVSTTANNNFVNGVPVFTFSSPFAAPGTSGTLNVNGLSRNLRNSYVMQYSLTVERELMRELGVRVSYLGSKGNQLPYGRNVNQPPPSLIPFSASRRPYPIYNNVVIYDNGAYSLYSGLQAGLQKRLSRGLQFNSIWIWAHEISEVDNTGNAELNTLIENAYDRRRDRGDVNSVPRHQWQNQALYELPFAAKNRWLGGWQVNMLLNLSTGHWLNPSWSGADPSNTNVTSGRPDAVQPIDYPRTLGAWYARPAFARPPDGRFGNAGRNIVEGPGYVIANFGFIKNFRTERHGAWQLGASFQNFFNHVNYGQPNMTANSTVGGAITSTHIFPAAGSPRTGMLSLRWNY